VVLVLVFVFIILNSLTRSLTPSLPPPPLLLQTPCTTPVPSPWCWRWCLWSLLSSWPSSAWPRGSCPRPASVPDLSYTQGAVAIFTVIPGSEAGPPRSRVGGSLRTPAQPTGPGKKPAPCQLRTPGYRESASSTFISCRVQYSVQCEVNTISVWLFDVCMWAGHGHAYVCHFNGELIYGPKRTYSTVYCTVLY